MSDKNVNELIIERVFDAPREVVWKAWTDPEMYKSWWGPKGFTSPECTMDVRVGGTYINCMQGTDGKKFYGAGVFREIVPNERLSYTDGFADEKGNRVPASAYGMSGEWPDELQVSITFEDV